MAEIAFVMDINGVCNNRETRVITPMPMNVASMNTNSIVVKFVEDGGAGVGWVSAPNKTVATDKNRMTNAIDRFMAATL